MKSRDFGMMVVGSIIGLIFIFCLQIFFGSRRSDRTPQLAGQKVPEVHFAIDFSKRYNIIRMRYNKAPTVYRNVKILGYTGEKIKQESGSLSKSYGYFHRWLVVELPDKRKVYLPSSYISALEEVTTP